jgi:PAS domain S-box-containing protein
MTDRAKILIVDDNPNNLQVLMSILERYHYEIRPALSGEVALAAIDTFIPDLILLDINMTGIDGYETCRRLKANERTQDIPVIFISAMHSTDDKLMAFQTGGVDYITKPFQIEEVLARVKTHIDLNFAKRQLKSLLDERTEQLTQNMKSLAESKERVKKIIESAMDGIITFDNSLCVVQCNSAAAGFFGVMKDDAIGMSIDCFIPQRFREAHMGHVRAFANPGTMSHRTNGLRNVLGLRANGEEFDIEASISHFDVEGEKQYTIIMRDVSERRRIDAALQSSLAEKTGLLNEVHHRVKNNLQVITSLLRLEAGRSDQADTKAVLTEMQARIRAMALLHESLYRKGIFASIDLATYLHQVVTQAVRAQLSRAGMVRLQLDLSPVEVTLDQAMPCGLLVNELISNCFKHAFPDEREGELRIVLQPIAGSNLVHLLVSDNGIGLPADFAEKMDKSLGLQLVGDLARQLGGILEVGDEAMLDKQKMQAIESGQSKHATKFGVTFAIDVIKSSVLSVD